VETSEPQYLYLTTKGRKSGGPREIEIWFTSRDERYYVIAEYATSHWVQNLQADRRVRIRVGEKAFGATARVILAETEPELHRAVQELSRKKYGWGEGVVIELVPDN
jgi:deazaflavin-dependent oxidoreductase (nitroreductase family)